ncbi:hypothetical protein CASFOL_042918 [Castilleja foliolosa]|uniref:X8 domain-containing protein n=1 Tax=Castilleja foliolosa TaxID=1961234 RepID=A0ABD3B7B4_9LAMI
MAMKNGVSFILIIWILTVVSANDEKSQSIGHQKAGTQWCVAKPDALDKNLLNLLDSFCFTEIDCQDIQPGGPCFEPTNIKAHASYALNAYFVKTGNCINCPDCSGYIITNDPSYGNCHYPGHLV